MQITAPAIVTAQHGANDSPILFRNETEARVAPQIRRDGAGRVGLVQPHALGSPPQGDDRIAIFGTKRAHDRSIVARMQLSLVALLVIGQHWFPLARFVISFVFAFFHFDLNSV
jgi:hypothetical protein